MDTSSKKPDLIADKLGVEPFEAQPVIVANEIENDYDFARQNIRDAVQKGQTALTDMLAVASVSQHPRTYEVVAALVKTVTEASRDLLGTSKIKKDIEDVDKPQKVTNNLFVGSTAELQKMIKNEQKK